MNKNRFEANELLKGSGDYNYRPSLIPFGIATDNVFENQSADLFRKAGSIIDLHEAVAFGDAKPFDKEQYANLCQSHKDIADAHDALARAMKADNDAGNINAYSSHMAASDAHKNASKIAEMMLDSKFPSEYNLLYPNMNSNSPRLGRNAAWDTENKNWNAAHRAFVASRMAYNNTVFDTGM